MADEPAGGSARTIRRLPLVPTIIVLAAVAAMVALGIWQIGRAREKEALLARYEAARNMPPIAFPTAPIGEDLPLFRRADGLCLRPVARRAVAGRSGSGEPGYSHIVECTTGAEGPGISVDAGWSKDPKAALDWRGGPVGGIIAPDRRMRMRLVSAAGLGGLEASAPPNVAQIPNNHRAYAVQWFLFAGIALLIYWLALRKRLASAEPAA